MSAHWAIFLDNDSHKRAFIANLMSNNPPKEFEGLASKVGMHFSKTAVRAYIEEEKRHGSTKLTTNKQTLKTMSSGEQKKALLHHILQSDPDYIILDNPFDNLDKATQEALRAQLEQLATDTNLIQLLSRKDDLLPFITNYAQLKKSTVVLINDISQLATKAIVFDRSIPPSLNPPPFDQDVLIQLKNISVSYVGKPVLNRIDWTIKKGEFWELKGPNGSGKTTILSMVTGENPKGYGQELYLFGQRKGSGESVWDIKKNIGYFTPALTDSFSGYHSIEHMLISGLNDSIGLYTKPTETQLRLAKEWLLMLNLWPRKDELFYRFSAGQKRLIMCARAMIKHPVLLILDEPTAGLDDSSASLFVALVNKFANESETAIIYVSHRSEPELTPEFVYQLIPGKHGSLGSQA